MVSPGNYKRRKHIRRSFLVSSVIFILVLCILISLLSYFVYSNALYKTYNTRLSNLMTYLEDEIDGDDIKRCIETNTHSEYYDNLQKNLNDMVDDFELEYLYIVIPSKDIMTNVISATSDEERAAGEYDMPLLEVTDAYSPDQLARYCSFMESDKINFFEESSEYGTFYTACKTLCDSDGDAVALMCADVAIRSLHQNVKMLIFFSVLIILAAFIVFGIFMFIWINKNITEPIIAVENSAREFVEKRKNASEDCEIQYNMPSIRVNNEVRSLAETIDSMANDINSYITEIVLKERHAKMVEAKNESLTRQAYSRINALSGNYICIYSVNPVTEEFVEYNATSEYESLGIPKHGDDFFNRTKIESQSRIYHEDLDRFNKMMTKEKIFDAIEADRVYALDYRLIIGGEPIHVRLKAALTDEAEERQLIIGVINVDAQVKRDQEYEYNLYIEKRKASIDALTGVKNKHAYVDMEEELNAQIKDGSVTPFAVVVCDVNGLKEINDTHGHQSGDDLLKQASSVICDIFKHSPVFRIGGDEFVVVVKGTDYENIDDLMEKMAKSNEENAASGEVVIACGMARYSGCMNVEDLFKRADDAMYENKNMLKNR